MPQMRFDARQKFAGAEGFGDVIIGTNFQPQNTVDFFYFGGEHQNRAAHLLPQNTADLIPIQLRQHHIQQNQVGHVGARNFNGAGTITRPANLIPTAAQIVNQSIPQGCIILDYHDFGHTSIIACQFGLLLAHPTSCLHSAPALPKLAACLLTAGKKSGRIAPSAYVRVNFDVKRFG